MRDFEENISIICRLIPQAKEYAVKLGGKHPYWQLILDAEALVEGRRTVHKGTSEELAHTLRLWIEKFTSSGGDFEEQA